MAEMAFSGLYGASSTTTDFFEPMVDMTHIPLMMESYPSLSADTFTGNMDWMFADPEILALINTTMPEQQLQQQPQQQPQQQYLSLPANQLTSSFSSTGFEELMDRDNEVDFEVDSANRSGCWGSNDSIASFAASVQPQPQKSLLSSPYEHQLLSGQREMQQHHQCASPGSALGDDAFSLSSPAMSASNESLNASVAASPAAATAAGSKRRPPLVRRSTWAGSETSLPFSPMEHEKPASPPVRKASNASGDAKRRKNSARAKARVARSESLPDGKQTKRFSKAAVAVLKDWIFAHTDNPYPTETEKQVFSSKTKLSISQINYWFINARRRLLQK